MSHTWVRKNAYRVVVQKPEENKPLGRSKSKWEDNIKIRFKEMGLEAWIGFIWFCTKID